MKKCLVAFLAIVMILSLAACGKKAEKTTPKLDGSPATGDASMSLDDALKKLESMTPEGWESYGNYGSAIYNEWDSDFLPDCFPDPIDGVKVDQTTFKDYGDDVISSSYSVGPIYYEAKEDYREYSVYFYATKAQLEEFIAGVEAKGLRGGIEDDGDSKTYYYGGNGWFMEIYFNSYSSEPNYDGLVSASATDSLYALPKSIDGIPLPQVGVIEEDYVNSYYIYDETNDTVDFNLAKDHLPDKSFAAWFRYYTVTMQDAKDYAKQLEKLGWEIKSESESEYDGTYYCSLFKDGIYAISNYYDYDVMMEVGFSDMAENLSY